MQNKWYSADDAGYVALNGGWKCGRCGCANEGCDVCSRCGWNRCGCQGGVVAAETTPARQKNAGWACTRCGCANEDCDTCSRCGLKRESSCGCQGGVVTAETANTRQKNAGWACVRCGCANEDCDTCSRCGWRRERSCGCDAGESRRQRCAACPEETGMCHAVQCCPANTALRPSRAAANGENRCGCERNVEKCGCERAAEKCGCASSANAASAVREHEYPVARGVGMMYAVKQKLRDVYQSESALRTGTLFPELHKPMNGRCPGCCNASTTGQQSAFSAWDLRLYLDTHPDDAEARALFGQLAREAEEPCYATTFLDGGPGWGWTDEPWPWECRDNNA